MRTRNPNKSKLFGIMTCHKTLIRNQQLQVSQIVILNKFMGKREINFKFVCYLCPSTRFYKFQHDIRRKKFEKLNSYKNSGKWYTKCNANTLQSYNNKTNLAFSLNFIIYSRNCSVLVAYNYQHKFYNPKVC